MKMYLDIDGVLLTTKNAKAVFKSELFIKYLEQFFNCETIELLKRIKATYWDTLKTEAIDFNSDFYWFDDNPFKSEIKVLEELGLKDRLLIFDLSRNDEYDNLISFLKSKMKWKFGNIKTTKQGLVFLEGQHRRENRHFWHEFCIEFNLFEI